jgi:transcriptional regulator with GAF, ATPase, and Fis domain
VHSENPSLISIDGVVYDIAKTILYCYPSGKDPEGFKLPDTLLSIESYALLSFPGQELALPESLLESELFGYVGGAFTGADKNGKVGLFEQAQHGTIFLDEIGDISPNLQARLLRVIQEKQVMRIGSDKIINIDVRIIAATNADLEEKIATGEFRAELFYRLNVIPLNILPLRSRKEDILPLLSHYIRTIPSLSEFSLQTS